MTTPYLEDPDLRLYVGDARAVLADLDDGSVDSIVTSPPYWALRDYGTGTWEGGDPDCEHRVGRQVPDSKAANVPNGGGVRPGVDASACKLCGAKRIDDQIGLEQSPEAYVAAIVEVFREAKRVLADHGTFWLNIGDSFTSGSRTYYDPDPRPRHDRPAGGLEGGTTTVDMSSIPRPATPAGLKAKELVGIPWRVAFALQADGWHLRMDNVWDKPNSMPESATDRPTKAHEYVFLFSKRSRYYYDQEAVREPFEAKTAGSWSRATYDARNEVEAGHKGTYRRDYKHPELHAPPQEETLPGLPGESPRAPDGRRVTTVQGGDGSIQHRDGERWPSPTGRNMRSVWRINTEPYKGAHFAAFPRELARRCILAGVPERVCTTCGKPSERITKRTVLAIREKPLVPEVTENGDGRNGHDSDSFGNLSAVETVGWTDCGHDTWRVGVVLDPFGGAGTTALVARNHQRHAILIELSQQYADDHILPRLGQQSLFS